MFQTFKGISMCNFNKFTGVKLCKRQINVKKL